MFMEIIKAMHPPPPLLLYAQQISSIILVMAMFLLPVAEYVGGGEVVYQIVIEYFCDMPVKTGEDGGLLRFPRLFEKSVLLIKLVCVHQWLVYVVLRCCRVWFQPMLCIDSALLLFLHHICWTQL